MNSEAITIINSYRDHADFNELLGVDRDQSAMSHLFEDLGYRVTVLRDRKRDTILDALEAVMNRLKPGGRLVVYYSGHGETIQGKDVFICTEARQRLLDQFHGVIPLELLRIITEAKGLRRLILNDSCRSNRYRHHKGGDDRYRGASSVKDIVATATQEAAIEGYPSTFTVLNGCSEDQVAIDLGASVGGLCSAAFRQIAGRTNGNVARLQIDQDFVYTHLAEAMKQLAAAHGHGFCPQPWLCGPVFELAGGTSNSCPVVPVRAVEIPKPMPAVVKAQLNLPRLLPDPRKLLTLEGHEEGVRAASWSADGSLVLTSGEDKSARLWDAETGQLLRTLEGHTNEVWAASFSPDCQRVLTGSRDNTARLWDAATGQLLHTLDGHTGRIYAVSFSPNGRRVLTGSDDDTARIWNADHTSPTCGKLLRTLELRTGAVHAALYSPDGHRIVTGSEDGTARLWDPESGQLLNTFEGHTSLIWAVSFSPDGRRVVTGSWDRIARLWDADPTSPSYGKMLCMLEGHAYGLRAVSFSPDGRWVLTGDENDARIWDAESHSPKFGQELARADVGKMVNAASFSPDGQRVVLAVSIMEIHDRRILGMKIGWDWKFLGEGQIWQVTY